MYKFYIVLILLHSFTLAVNVVKMLNVNDENQLNSMYSCMWSEITSSRDTADHRLFLNSMWKEGSNATYAKMSLINVPACIMIY